MIERDLIMKTESATSGIAEKIHTFVRRNFTPHFGQIPTQKSDPVWRRLGALGSRLWFDTGNIEEAKQRWTREFSALTTNNTLLNKEIQTGRYDALIADAAALLTNEPCLNPSRLILEIAFILNGWHALRLVEQFDAFVSVEEHTDLAADAALAVEYGRRYYRLCPERFIIKIPFTPAGLLATRILSREGIPVNHTLGFSARQNYAIVRISRPAYVNVFLGRLNSFVADNKIGDGSYVGEKATLASQKVIRQLRRSNRVPSLQIGASFRNGGQVRDLAGIDVMTIPPKAADEFLALKIPPDQLMDQTPADYPLGLNKEVSPDSVGLNTLWEVNDKLIDCIDDLENEDIDGFTPDGLLDYFETHQCHDLLIRWSKEQIATSAKEGKIPRLENWSRSLADKSIGLDSLMNLAGLNSFSADQRAMDDRIRKVLKKK
jgi:transaldolase